MHTWTPLTASTMSWNPWKSSTTWWSTGTPVVCSNWEIVQPGPARLKASFHITSVPPGTISPSAPRQSGRVTRESRGMLIP